MDGNIVILIHLVDGVLLLAMMALMFFTIRLILNSAPFQEWVRNQKKQPAEKKPGRSFSIGRKTTKDHCGK